jgi:hypothetical protein
MRVFRINVLECCVLCSALDRRFAEFMDIYVRQSVGAMAWVFVESNGSQNMRLCCCLVMVVCANMCLHDLGIYILGKHTW